MLPENQHGLKPSARPAFCGVQGVFSKGSQKASGISSIIVERLMDGG